MLFDFDQDNKRSDFYSKPYGFNPYIHTLLRKSMNGIVYLTHFKLILLLYLQLIISYYTYYSKKLNQLIIRLSSLFTISFFFLLLLYSFTLFSSQSILRAYVCTHTVRYHVIVFRFIHYSDVSIAMLFLVKTDKI